MLLKDRRSCQDCTEMVRKGNGYESLEWIHLAADKFSVAVCCKLCCVPSGCRIPWLAALLLPSWEGYFLFVPPVFLSRINSPSHTVLGSRALCCRLHSDVDRCWQVPFSSIRAYDGIASKIMFWCAVLSMWTDRKPAGCKQMTLQSRDPMEQILTDN